MKMEEHRLPKNFCQMGEKEDRMKIYLEDYVHAFLQKCRRGPEPWQTGVLLGIHDRREDSCCLFIRGAVLSRKARLESGRLVFPGEAWEEIRSQIREYFPDLGICGWFVYEKYGMTVDRLSLKRSYETIFSQGDKVLLLGEEEREDFYILKEGSMVKLMGYYLYYERNESMQEYMAIHGPADRVDERASQDVAVAFRKRLEKKRQEGIEAGSPLSADGQEETPSSMAGSSILRTAVVLALAWILGNAGGVLWKNYQGNPEMMVQEAWNLLEGESEGEPGVSGDGLIYTEEVTQEEERELTEPQTVSMTETKETMEEMESAAVTHATDITEATEAAMVYWIHTVQAGETLEEICMKYYGSIGRLEEICRMNQLEDPDRLVQGQALRLP